MLDYTKDHPDATDELSTMVREIGTATVVEEFRRQLESYWFNEWPFNIPISNNNPFAWWMALKPHPHARVLSVKHVS